ncbi:RluA family pseudouridine synthase [Oceanobacillus sp. CAU 1775]
MKWMIEAEHDGMIVRDYLQKVRGLSRRILIAAKSDRGKIILNGNPVTVRASLHSGDKLEVTLPVEKISDYLFPVNMNLEIVYEDAAVLVLNKQAGIATLPSPLHKSSTVANGILWHYQQIDNPNTVHVVTRLDRDTSGLILIAKERLSHSLLSRSQKEFGIERKYQAIVEGRLENKIGTINAPIGRKANSIVEREVTETGKEAITHYEVLQEWENYALLSIELETGRTHQIRVHFSHVGCSLAGDDLYGGTKAVIDRQALHCSEIKFRHPYTNELLEFKIELPKDIKIAIEKVNSGSYD